jgi:pectate lyase
MSCGMAATHLGKWFANPPTSRKQTIQRCGIAWLPTLPHRYAKESARWRHQDYLRGAPPLELHQLASPTSGQERAVSEPRRVPILRKPRRSLAVLVTILGLVSLVIMQYTDSPVTAPIPAFPGAEGFGANTPGGRGGRILEVTNLEDSGPGSLRAALEASGRRIVVFRTGGTITLESSIRVRHPYLTIAGQTAPGDGITLKMNPAQHHGLMDLETHDVVFRGLRFRQGAHKKTDAAIPLDIKNASRVVIDHCSLSWSTDEVLTTYNDTSDITISWNIIAEGLSHSTHYEGEHSRGLFISGDDSRNITAHHNLLAHNRRRNPEVSTAGVADIRNNVIYNWGSSATLITDKRGSAGMNVVGNYYKRGPSTTTTVEIDGKSYRSGMSLYATGNLRADGSPAKLDARARRWAVPEPVSAPHVTTTSARQAYADVLAGAGARVPATDPIDARILGEVASGTGRIIDDPEEVGGWPMLDPGTPRDDSDHDGMPDAWETERGLDPANDDSGADRNGDGYTNIEEYINGLMDRHGLQAVGRQRGWAPSVTGFH